MSGHYAIHWWPYDPKDKDRFEYMWRAVGPDGMPEDIREELYHMRQLEEERAPWEDDLHLLDLDECERLAKAVQARIEQLRPSPADQFQGKTYTAERLRKLVALMEAQGEMPKGSLAIFDAELDKARFLLDIQAPGSGSALAEAVPGDDVADHHVGDAASPPAPPASSPHPSQEPLSPPYGTQDDPEKAAAITAAWLKAHGLIVQGGVTPRDTFKTNFISGICNVCHRPLPLCEC